MLGHPPPAREWFARDSPLVRHGDARVAARTSRSARRFVTARIRRVTRNKERRDSHAWVYAIEPGIVRYDEPPALTADEARLVGDGIDAATRGMPEFSMVIDLTVASLPDPKVRKALRENLFERKELTYVALFTGKNTAINLLVRLVLGQVMRDGLSYSISNTFEDALSKLRAHHARGARREQNRG